MTEPDLISLLEARILEHPNLKKEDHAVVRKLCDLIRIEETGDINEYHRSQVEAEAGGVYLKSKYDQVVEKFDTLIEKHKAGRYVELGSRDDEGLKWTIPGKKEWLLATDSRYVALLEMFKEAERLHVMLRELTHIVFCRDRKLEQLSINYRREAEADKRTGI